MGFLDVGDVETNIVLECFEGFMPEHPADVVDVGIAANQLTGAASAEHVRGQRLFEAGLFACFENDAPECVVGHPVSSIVREEGPALRLWAQGSTYCAEIALEETQSRGTHGHDPFLTSLPQDLHDGMLEVDTVHIEPEQFGRTNPTAVEQFQHGAVDWPVPSWEVMRTRSIKADKMRIED